MIEVLKLALKALNAGEHAHLIMNTDGIKDKVRQAIAELENQEPVATVTSETGADITMSWWHEPALPVGTKLFTHPPQRTWVGLTDEEIDTWNIVGHESLREFVRAIEAKLKEKNT
jgi:uncharacterized protein with ACT and thioredoxin-like domain